MGHSREAGEKKEEAWRRRREVESRKSLIVKCREIRVGKWETRVVKCHTIDEGSWIHTPLEQCSFSGNHREIRPALGWNQPIFVSLLVDTKFPRGGYIMSIGPLPPPRYPKSMGLIPVSLP